MNTDKPTFIMVMMTHRNTRNGKRKTTLSARYQQGVVLVFSLVTLLLLTLLGVNMIQQNRLEFMMASNAQMQTETFSAGEDILKVAENHIFALHGINSQECREPNDNGTTITYNCYDYDTNTGRYTTLVGQSPSYTKGATTPNEIYLCKPSTNNEFQSLYLSDENTDTPQWEITNSLGLVDTKIGNTEASITSIACITSTANIEVFCKNEGTQELSIVFPCNSLAANCPTLLYSLKVISKTSSTTAAQRTVESKYAVRCDGTT